MNKSIKEKMVDKLKKDCEILLDYKIPDALKNIKDEKGVGTYRNLTKALADNIKLIEEYDWKLMWSKYTTVINGKEVKQVAIWEQNGDGDIRNHEVFDIKEDKETISNKRKANTSDFSMYFNDKLALTGIQKDLLRLNPSSTCLRCEGSTFGTLISSIHHASSNENLNIGIVVPIKSGLTYMQESINEIVDNYIVEENSKIISIIADMDCITIRFNNYSKIEITWADINARQYRFDYVFFAYPWKCYNKEDVNTILKQYGNVLEIMIFNTVDEEKYLYDIKNMRVKEVVDNTCRIVGATINGDIKIDKNAIREILEESLRKK